MVVFLTIGTQMSKWIKPTCEGRVPAPRYDTCLMYDSKGSILLVFSGHSSHCYSDLFTLDVESIVGSPYALIDMLRGGTFIVYTQEHQPYLQVDPCRCCVTHAIRRVNGCEHSLN